MPTKQEIVDRYTAMIYDPALNHSDEANSKRLADFMAELEKAEPTAREKRDAEHEAKRVGWKAKGGGKIWGNAERRLFEVMSGHIVIECRLCSYHKGVKVPTKAEAYAWWDTHAVTVEHRSAARTNRAIDTLIKGLVDAEHRT